MKRFGSLALFILLTPTLAQAHDGSLGGGFIPGLTHPVLGLDHLLAMLAVGIISAQMGGKAIWTVPLTFVIVMLAGGVMGLRNVPFLPVEMGIAVSVLVLGVAIASQKKLPVIIAMAAVGFFALFHGHAHGTEMPHLAQPALYALGFVTGTAAIHVGGVSVGLLSRTFTAGPSLLRYIGAGIAGIGFHLIVM